MQTLKIGKVTLTWLSGGVTHLDGGAMFGVVPKPLWSRRYPSNDNNQIKLMADPILVQMEGKNLLIESGLGNGKLTDKQKRNYGVTKESEIEDSLKRLGLDTNSIDYVLMTHLHFDHACGLTKPKVEGYQSSFPNAQMIVSKIEWDEMRSPNIRSKSTYWQENWQAIESQVVTFESTWSLGPIQMIHTGGHSDGHSIIIIEDGGEMAIHMADLMPTHAHQNVLWVMAYDDYPMDSIREKEKWLPYATNQNAWFTFYHDAFYRAVKWDQETGQLKEFIEVK
ncbi:YtnP family quorum-quenching lactonase [Neobacillus dielmonensis]|uniref:YtnP family quorum-quenching lactonase n=1 Tax=Neobacillus dielmonensis TaxID=1347369 RepID=UPI0005AA3BD9|nr:MBL fold metallo-hydrolase [Neobacillus dielmonensis]